MRFDDSPTLWLYAVELLAEAVVNVLTFVAVLWCVALLLPVLGF